MGGEGVRSRYYVVVYVCSSKLGSFGGVLFVSFWAFVLEVLCFIRLTQKLPK